MAPTLGNIQFGIFFRVERVFFRVGFFLGLKRFFLGLAPGNLATVERKSMHSSTLRLMRGGKSGQTQ